MKRGKMDDGQMVRAFIIQNNHALIIIRIICA